MGAIKLYVDNGSSFTEVKYNYFTISVGWQKNKATRDFGANKYLIRTPIDEPYVKRYSSPRPIFVVESESPTQYFAQNNWGYSVDTFRGEIVYYGYTYPFNSFTDETGFEKVERGGYSTQVTEYTPQSRTFNMSGILSSGYQIKYDCNDNASDQYAKGAPPLNMKIIMVEPNIPYGEFSAELGDEIKIYDDMYENTSGSYWVGNLGEKRIIADQSTYRVEYTITNNRRKEMKIKSAFNDGDMLKWSTSGFGGDWVSFTP